MKTKQYLGDGVYAEMEGDGFFDELVLTTEYGISITNTIYLEVEVVLALLRFLGVELKTEGKK